MRSINYYYTSVMKQVFLVIFMACMAARVIVFTEVLVFDIPGYEEYNFVTSIVFNLIIIAIAFFLFIGFRFFRTDFTESEVTNVNTLINRKQSIQLSEVDHVVFTKKGVKFYKTEDAKKHDFMVKFRRFGMASPVGIESLEKLIEYKEIPFTKQYTETPGMYKSKVLTIGYAVLIISLLLNSYQVILLAAFLPFNVN